MPVTYNNDVLGPTTNLIPQYDQYKVYSTPPFDENNCTYLGSLKLQSEPTQITKQVERKARRFTLALRCTNGEDNMVHNVSDVYISAYFDKPDNLAVNIGTKSLTGFYDTSEFYKFYVFWTKTTRSETVEFAVELWMETRDGISAVDLQPTFFQTYLDSNTQANYDKVANIHYNGYSRIDALFAGMAQKNISHQDMMNQHSSGYASAQSYSSYTADNSTNDLVVLDPYQSYVVLATNGEARTIATIAPATDYQYQNGRRLVCFCWNPITFHHAGNLDSAGDNHLVMRGSADYKTQVNEAIEFLRVGNLWVQVQEGR